MPPNLSASVVNPATGELSVRIQNLGGAPGGGRARPEHGPCRQQRRLVATMDHSVPLYVKDLAAGEHSLILTAESSAGAHP